MIISITKKQHIDVPEALEWAIPYLLKASKKGYKLPARIYYKDPIVESTTIDAQAARVIGEGGNYKVLPDSHIFLHSRNGSGKRRFSKRQLLDHLAHELAHLQFGRLCSNEHGEEWNSFYISLKNLFMVEYDKSKAKKANS